MNYTKVGLGTAAAVTTVLVATAKREAIANGIHYMGAHHPTKQLYTDIFKSRAESTVRDHAVSKESITQVLNAHLTDDLMKKHDVAKDKELRDFFHNKLTKKQLNLNEFKAALADLGAPDNCQDVFGCSASQFRQVRNGLLPQLQKIAEEHGQNLTVSYDDAKKLIQAEPGKFGAPRRSDAIDELLQKAFKGQQSLKLSELLAYAKNNGGGYKFTSWFDKASEWPITKGFHNLSDEFFSFFFKDEAGRNIFARAWDNIKSKWSSKES